ncbi:MAG: S1 RNA-binding domain-containing protein [Acidobacteria bacterium]|nr:S1 RNA-binding domain-containing protein [Acidobacteriota bacterium]MBU4308017.1 S1 RNA-binding domain-containing protein [Acidobacteriota bacterium]MCG2812322.1 S1 RNA-binding domain-containing protein [Candidatus Aminicenantes bacterium]
MSDTNDTIENNSEDFSELVKNYDLKNLASNAAIEGRIVDIVENRVVIDIGQKTEGILDRQELLDWDGNMKYKIGDAISVLSKNVNFKEGYIIVSKKQLDEQEGWENVFRAYKKNIPLQGKITKLTPDEKGFMVDMGVEMFLPMSQVDIQRVKAPKKMLGKDFWFKVVKLDKKEKSGTVSRRILLEDEKQEKLKNLLGSLEVGQVVKGIVTSIVDYGAFVDLGGLEGLVHKDNISYGRINHPKEKLRKGDEIEVKVLEIDKDRGKISLGIKQKFTDPWIDIETRYPIGKRLIAKVVKIVSFGAFIELEEGVEGLLHISDLTWEGRPTSVEEYVAVGDKLWVQVIEFSKENRKIKLGLKQLEMRPEEKYLEKHSRGEIVRAKVKKILKSRVFLGLEQGVEGVVKISDISYYHIESPEEYMKEGEEIDAMIISNELDRNYKVQLGIKHLSESEWKTFLAKHKPGNTIEVTVRKITDGGIAVEITRNIEGFIRSGDIDEEKITMQELEQKYKPGDKLEAMIARTELDRKKVYLSLRALNKVREREELQKYMKGGDDQVTTIGDLLQNELDKKK